MNTHYIVYHQLIRGPLGSHYCYPQDYFPTLAKARRFVRTHKPKAFCPGTHRYIINRVVQSRVNSTDTR